MNPANLIMGGIVFLISIYFMVWLMQDAIMPKPCPFHNVELACIDYWNSTHVETQKWGNGCMCSKVFKSNGTHLGSRLDEVILYPDDKS